MLVFASKHQAGPADDCGVCRVAGGWAREPGSRRAVPVLGGSTNTCVCA